MKISTARLLMRPITIEDAPLLAAIYADAEVSRYLTALDEAATARQVERFLEEWQERGFGILALCERDTGTFLGRSGLHYWPQFDEVEVGWVLRRDAWGKGLATEAGTATLSWGFRTVGLAKIIAIIASANAGSLAVARRLQMQPVRDEQLFGMPVTVFEISTVSHV